ITTADMTADLEKEMDEVAVSKKSKESVVKKSRADLAKILNALFLDKDQLSEALRSASAAQSIVGICPQCAKNLVVRYSRFGKQFIGCSGYPDCTQTYPLPGNGKITFTGNMCDECALPMIKVFRFKSRPYEMCIYPDCKSKADWVKKPRKEVAKKGAKKKATKKKATTKKKAPAKRAVKKTVKKVTKKTSSKKTATKKTGSKK
ncbi:MAG: hypothetical protein GOV15_03405, partial [Candidatus Diapherotrites archaeon]|nr:hypothetical protein [Candidatus Diapherotrites archaeon]